MKRRLLAFLLLLATLLSACSALTVMADGINEADIVSVSGIQPLDVAVGTPFAEVADMLPRQVTLQMKTRGVGASEELHNAKMEESDWTLYNKSAVTVSGGKVSFHKSAPNVKAVSGGEYTDFVLETTLRGTANDPDNNFGVMLRATDITES